MRGANGGRFGAPFWAALVAACSGEAPLDRAPQAPTDLPAGVDAPKNAHGETPELMAVGSISGCSGALIDVGGAADEAAYALTAGHCVTNEPRSPNEIALDLPGDTGMFWPGFFWDTAFGRFGFQVSRVAYRTMHLRDLAILRLQQTNGEVLARGVVPLRLAQVASARGDPIAIVGHPRMESMRRSRCENGDPTYLAEDEFLFRETSNPCAGLARGSSGSPVLNAAGEIFGVMSTASGRGRPCSRDNPCDLSQAELRNAATPTSYFADVAGLGSCFIAGRFELDAPGCPLTKPTPTVAWRGIGRYVQSRVEAIATWDVSLAESPAPYYRFKSGPALETRCDDEQGYGAARTVAAEPTIEESLPAREGLYLLCIEGSMDGDSFDAADAALSLLSEVDNTPP